MNTRWMLIQSREWEDWYVIPHSRVVDFQRWDDGVARGYKDPRPVWADPVDGPQDVTFIDYRKEYSED